MNRRAGTIIFTIEWHLPTTVFDFAKEFRNGKIMKRKTEGTWNSAFPVLKPETNDELKNSRAHR